MRRIRLVSRLKLLEIMNRLDFFTEFTQKDRQLLLEDKLHVYRCDGGKMITRQGDQDTNLYLILSGQVRIIKDEQELGTLRAGEFLGEGGFVARRPRSASAQAASECILLRLDNTALRSLSVALREKVKDAIIRGMAARIVYLNGRLELTRV